MFQNATDIVQLIKYVCQTSEKVAVGQPYFFVSRACMLICTPRSFTFSMMYYNVFLQVSRRFY